MERFPFCPWRASDTWQATSIDCAISEPNSQEQDISPAQGRFCEDGRVSLSENMDKAELCPYVALAGL